MTLDWILAHTPGAILDLRFTYDLMHYFQVVCSANDSNPETGYVKYLHQVWLYDRNFENLLKKLETLLRSTKLISE